MLNSVKDYASAIKTRAGETYTGYTSKDPIEQLLLESTSNDTWQLSNQKLLELADATNTADGPRIIDHLLEKIKSPPFEWRRILKAMNALDFMLKNGSLAVLGKVQMVGSSVLSGLQSFDYQEESIDRGKQIRDKAYLLQDLLQNKHKLDVEREAAQQYRQKFYPTSGGYNGSGAGSIGSSAYSGNGGYTSGPIASSSDSAKGVQVYSPYQGVGSSGQGQEAQAQSSLSQAINTGGNSTWGPSSSASTPPATYNITNNNNINYNYGSNITAIQNDGPVPTFHEIDKQRKKDKKQSGPPTAGAQAWAGISSIQNSSIGQGVSNAVSNSSTLATASDAIKRNVGVDIRRALGGKTAVEIAEDRLKADQAANGGGGYGGSYQGISIPIDYSTPSSTQKGASINTGTDSSLKLNTKAGAPWGSQNTQETKKQQNTSDLFGRMDEKSTNGKKRLDDDSDDDEKPQKVQQQEQPTQKQDLLDLGNDSKPTGNIDLLSQLGSTPQQPSQSTSNLFDLGGPPTSQPPATNTLDLFATPAVSQQPQQPQSQSSFNFMQPAQQQPAGFSPSPFGEPMVQQQPMFDIGNQQQQKPNAFDFMNSAPQQSAPQPTQQQPNAFDFMSSGVNPPQQAPQQPIIQQQPQPPLQQQQSGFNFMQQQPQTQQQPVQQMTDMFGGMTVAQTIQQPAQPSQGGNLFGNMNMKQPEGQVQTAQPLQSQQVNQTPAEPEKPKDAWSMGANLINF